MSGEQKRMQFSIMPSDSTSILYKDDTRISRGRQSGQTSIKDLRDLHQVAAEQCHGPSLTRILRRLVI